MSTDAALHEAALLDAGAPRPGLDPRTRLALLMCAGLLAISLDHAVALILLTALTTLPLTLIGLSRRAWARGALIALGIVWATVLSQGLFYADEPRVPLASIGPLTMYREGVIHGLIQSLRLVSVTFAGLAVALSTPPDRLFAALLRLRVPFGVAFMAVTALRLVPETARESMVVRQARARRGRPAHRRSPWKWLLLEVGLLRPVVARALRRARAMAESLDARGFDPVAPRAVRRPLVLGWLDWAILSAALPLTTAVVLSRLLFALYTAEIAWFPALRPLYGAVRSWL